MCWHADAVKHFTLADEQWVASLNTAHMYEHIDDVILHHDTVTLINGSAAHKIDLVLSVCTAAAAGQGLLLVLIVVVVYYATMLHVAARQA